VHHPADVVGAFAISALAVAVVELATRRLLHRGTRSTPAQ
jgi:membrane-associated phospholipid phosphatase